MKIFSSNRFFASILGAALVAAVPAMAMELHDGQSAETLLGPDASAVTYLVDRTDGYHVIVTVRTAHDAKADALHQPPAIRFSSRILPGQTIDLSVPDTTAPASTVLEITRRAERVAIETKQAADLIN